MSKGNGTGSFNVELTPLPPQRCVFGDGVRAAVSAYRRALHEIRQASDENTDLDGNYARLHIKALRIAMLLASLENGGRIELRHWARAQQITERWRADLHHLVAQLGQDGPSRDRAAEDQIMAFLVRQGVWVVPRRVAQYLRDLSSGEIKTHLERMAAVGRVEARPTGRTTWYRAVGVEGVEGVDVLNGVESVYTSPSPPAPPAANQPIPEGVDKNEGGSTPSTPQHLQHHAESASKPPPLPRPKTGDEAIRSVLQAIRNGDHNQAMSIMDTYPTIDWSQERERIAQAGGVA